MRPAQRLNVGDVVGQAPRIQEDWQRQLLGLRALAGDAQALAALGVTSPDQIFVIDTRPEPRAYLIHPDGRVERYEPNDRAASRAWIEQQFGHAYRMHPEAHVVRAYTGLYAAQPKDPTPNVPVSIAPGVWGMRHALGPVVLMPTGEEDQTLLHAGCTVR